MDVLPVPPHLAVFFCFFVIKILCNNSKISLSDLVILFLNVIVLKYELGLRVYSQVN